MRLHALCSAVSFFSWIADGVIHTTVPAQPIDPGADVADRYPLRRRRFATANVAIRAQWDCSVHTCEVLERREQPLRILAEVAERAAACH